MFNTKKPDLTELFQFFSVYKSKPKFLFGFHGELSHDSYNLIGVADNDLLGLLKSLHSSGALNNTLLVLMADHGHRLVFKYHKILNINTVILGLPKLGTPFKENKRNVYHFLPLRFLHGFPLNTKKNI